MSTVIWALAASSRLPPKLECSRVAVPVSRRTRQVTESSNVARQVVPEAGRLLSDKREMLGYSSHVARVQLVVLLSTFVLYGCGGSPTSTDAAADAPADGAVDSTADAPPDTSLDTASGCTDHDECIEASPVCRRGTCSGCLVDAECEPLGLAVCASDGSCQACSRDADCLADAPFCQANDCVVCRSDEDCSVGVPACVLGTCQSCTVTDTCSPEQRAEEWRFAVCAAIAREEGEGGPVDSFAAVFCSGRGDVFPPLRQLAGAIEGGRVTVSEAALAECRASASLEACVAGLSPIVPPGGACHLTESCLDGWCDLGASCPGVCAARAVEGAACGRDEECTTDYCRLGVCITVPTADEECFGRCVAGLTCERSRTPDACGPLHEVGGVCLAGGDCREGLICFGGSCAEARASGETCREGFGLQDCALGLRCSGAVCRVPTADGESCTATTECTVGSRCNGGTCTEILLPGEACGEGSACALGTACVLGVCSPLPDVGESCADSGACLRGTCSAGACAESSAFSSCDEGSYFLDALDPCGAATSCISTPSGWQCMLEGAPGAECEGVATLPCRRPDATCNDLGVCEATCAP